MGPSRLPKENLIGRNDFLGENLKKPFFVLVISVSKGYNNSVRFERGKIPGRFKNELFIRC